MFTKIFKTYIGIACFTGFIGGMCESEKSMIESPNPNLTPIQNLILRPFRIWSSFGLGFARWGVFLPYSVFENQIYIKNFFNRQKL